MRRSDTRRHPFGLRQRGSAVVEEVLCSVTDGPYALDDLIARVEHYKLENELIQSLPATLNAKTITTFGQTRQRSQQAAEQLLANQTPETIHLVNSANRLGAHAASAFGAGFGGSVWALVGTTKAPFLPDWQQDYANAFPHWQHAANFFTSRPGIPAQVWAAVIPATACPSSPGQAR